MRVAIVATRCRNPNRRRLRYTPMWRPREFDVHVRGLAIAPLSSRFPIGSMDAKHQPDRSRSYSWSDRNATVWH